MVKIKHEKKHEFLGMVFDFTLMPGSVNIIHKDHVLDTVEEFPEECNGKVITPLSSDLVQRISKQSRPDIGPTILVLGGRAMVPNKDDLHKLRKLWQYLHATMEEHLVVRIDRGLNITKWNIDASFVANDDFWSYSGRILTILEYGGGVITSSVNQKLNS